MGKKNGVKVVLVLVVIVWGCQSRGTRVVVVHETETVSEQWPIETNFSANVAVVVAAAMQNTKKSLMQEMDMKQLRQKMKTPQFEDCTGHHCAEKK